MVEISCDILLKTPDAILIFDGSNKVWLPLSTVDQLTLPQWEGSEILGATIEVKEWKAKQAGLI